MSDFRIAFTDSTTDTVQTYIWTSSWATVGNPFSIATMSNPAITYMGKNKIALADPTLLNVRCLIWDDTDWNNLGAISADLPLLASPSLATIYPNRIALISDSYAKLFAYHFSGSYFSILGDQLTVSAILKPSICGMDFKEIAYIEQSNRVLRRMKLIGNTWTQIGSGLTITGGTNISITALTKTRIAYIDDTNDSLRVYDWNETTLVWTLLASGLSIAGITTAIIEAIDINKVAFFDLTNKELRTYTLTGSTWAQTGSGLSIPGATANPNMTGFYKPFNISLYNEVSLEGNEIWPTSD